MARCVFVTCPRSIGRAVITVGVLVAASSVAGCGDQSTGPTAGEPDPTPVASVSVTPSSTRILVGEGVTLTATPLDAGGDPLSGREVTWNSSDPTRASVSGGEVTGIGAGQAVITATSEGKVGSATVTVDARVGLVVVGGDAQMGLAGYPLADSLQVRLFDEGGTAVAGVPIAWTASAGSVSTSVTTTDADGYARVQWTVGEGDGDVGASGPDGSAASFSATGHAPVACELTPSQETERFSLGPTDFAWSLEAAKPVRIVVLFVDFSDVPASEDPDTLMASIVAPGLALLEELSYGRADVTATPITTWYRMSQPIGAYTWRTYEGHKQYISEAMALADADVDFAPYDAVFIITPSSAEQPISPTFNGGQLGGVTFDGRTFGNGVTFGRDARRYPASVLAHETGHMFGLVDLYAFEPNGGDPFRGDQFRFTGSWTLMADVFRPGHYTAWEKRKLGWVQPSEYLCLHEGEGVEVVLDPVETPGGLKMVAMPTGASSATVAEVRRRVGLDDGLCAEGVLVYDVDAAVPTGFGPLRIRGSRVHRGDCGPWSDATFDLGEGGVDQLDVPGSLTMRLLQVDAEGRYRVRFKR